MFEPSFQLTPAIVRDLMNLEADRQQVAALPIDVAMLASLRETARLAATHHSTQIEGNRLTMAQVAEVLAGSAGPGLERDELEVRHYYRALEAVEALAAKATPIRARDVQRLHGLVMQGRAVHSPFRPRQRRLLELFRRQGTATSAQLAAHLGISTRTAPALCRGWVEAGFLVVHDASRKNRAYALTADYEAAINQPGP